MGCRDILTKYKVSLRAAFTAAALVIPILVSADTAVPIHANISGGAADQRARLERLVVETQAVLNSPRMKARVLSSTFKDRSKRWSGESVWAAIIAGKELKSAPNGQWDMDLRIAVHCNDRVCNNLGWTYPSATTVYLNNRGRKKSNPSKFNTRSDSGIVGTLCHEQMHKLGYGHSSASAKQSVPYSIGTICAEIHAETRRTK